MYIKFLSMMLLCSSAVLSANEGTNQLSANSAEQRRMVTLVTGDEVPVADAEYFIAKIKALHTASDVIALHTLQQLCATPGSFLFDRQKESLLRDGLINSDGVLTRYVPEVFKALFEKKGSSLELVADPYGLEMVTVNADNIMPRAVYNRLRGKILAACQNNTLLDYLCCKSTLPDSVTIADKEVCQPGRKPINPFRYFHDNGLIEDNGELKAEVAAVCSDAFFIGYAADKLE